MIFWPTTIERLAAHWTGVQGIVCIMITLYLLAADIVRSAESSQPLAVGTTNKESATNEDPLPPAQRLSPAPPTADGMQTSNRVDRLHAKISRWILLNADRLDQNMEDAIVPDEHAPSRTFQSFFGDRSIDDEGKDSRVSVVPGVRIEEHGVSPRLRFRAQLDLPRVERRVQLIVQNLRDEDTLLTDPNDRRTELPPERNDSTATLRVHAIQRMHFSSDFDAGIKLKPQPVPLLRLTGAVTVPAGLWDCRLSEAGFWRSDEGFGEKTQLLIERRFDDRRLFQILSSALYSESSKGLETGQMLTLTRFYGARRALRYRIAAETVSDPAWSVARYFARVGYRFRTRRNWLFVELEPGLDFTQEDHYRTTPLALLSLEILFGDVKR